MRRFSWVLLVVCAGGAAASLFLGPASPGDVMLRSEVISLAELAKVPEARWLVLASKKVHFGHMSVGLDILAGIEAIQKELPQIGLRIVQGEPAALQGRPGLAHAPIGSNGDPASKMRAFAQQLEAAGADGVDVALMKFCYVDIGPGTDVDRLFADYRQAVVQWRTAHPRTQFGHCTVPLCTPRTTWKERLKSLFGRGEAAVNRLREAFNDKLRAEYGGTEPVFDIAAAESTLPNGTRVTAGGVPCLAACYTSDGGHLNDPGRRAVAREFLRVFAEWVR